MSPFIKSGSILTIKPDQNIYIGDIVLYRTSGGLIAHRVIGERSASDECFFVMKGDNLNHKDGLVRASHILGKVVKMENARGEFRMDSSLCQSLNCLIAIISPYLLPQLLTPFRRLRSLIQRVMP